MYLVADVLQVYINTYYWSCIRNHFRHLLNC